MSAPAIEIENLRKVYRSRWSGREILAVDGVSLSVEQGTSYGLLGPNGAGKTTTVKMLLSAVHPTSGSARIFGRNAAETEARRPIGYLPENHRFPTYLTGAGMLRFYGALSGMSGDALRLQVGAMLEKVGLERWGDVRLGKYSKGMLQRLGLAQALIHQPRILVLDEPSDGVDPVGRRQIRELLQSLEQQGTTVFINSHLLAEVELMCRDVAIIHQGRVVLQGRVKDLVAGKGYRLTVPGVLAENLREALAQKAASVAARDGLLDWQFTGRAEVNAAVDLLRGAGVEIEALTPTTSTLEDVFIRTVNG